MTEKSAKPQLRLAGFDDTWEQRELGSITSSYSGGTPTAGKAEYYDGDIPFIRSGEINEEKTGFVPESTKYFCHNLRFLQVSVERFSQTQRIQRRKRHRVGRGPLQRQAVKAQLAAVARPQLTGG